MFASPSRQQGMSKESKMLESVGSSRGSGRNRKIHSKPMGQWAQTSQIEASSREGLRQPGASPRPAEAGHLCWDPHGVLGVPPSQAISSRPGAPDPPPAWRSASGGLIFLPKPEGSSHCAGISLLDSEATAASSWYPGHKQHWVLLSRFFAEMTPQLASQRLAQHPGSPP